MKLFLFHCWGGDGRSCWSGSTADHFAARAIQVVAPDFPDRADPILSAWLSEVRSNVKTFELKDEWVLVGHSLGCPTILRLLETFGECEKVKAIILVAGFAKDLGIDQIRNFVDQDFNWQKIKSKAEKIIILNSDNDPYIRLDEGERMATLLGAEFIVEHNAGHLNEGSGFTNYPRLVQLIEEIMLS
ncbi:serine hydrolase family protein [Candidatus Micrarchaeota archaeon]|nr:serine hydrolase family protein [Candidatus Micrarchaeota archaeon]